MARTDSARPQPGWRPSGPQRSRRGDRAERRVRLASAAVLLGGILAAIWFLMPSWNPPVPYVVVVGVSEYGNPLVPPNVGASEDAERLHTTLASGFGARREPAEDRVKDWSNRLRKNELLSGLRELATEVPRSASCLVVYCSMHGLVDEDSPALLAQRGDLRESVLSCRTLVNALDELPVERVLLLLDTPRVDSAWTLGTLSNEFAPLLERELESADLERTTILLAAGDHERSWISPQWSRSVFSHFLEQGLLREADGFGGAPANRRISAHELFAYLEHEVGDWARTHRGTTQTVLRLGRDDDFDVAVVTPPPPEDEPRPGDEPEEAEEAEDSGEETEAGEKSPADGPDESSEGNGDAAPVAAAEKDAEAESRVDPAAAIAEFRQRFRASWAGDAGRGPGFAGLGDRRPRLRSLPFDARPHLHALETLVAYGYEDGPAIRDRVEERLRRVEPETSSSEVQAAPALTEKEAADLAKLASPETPAEELPARLRPLLSALVDRLGSDTARDLLGTWLIDFADAQPSRERWAATGRLLAAVEQELRELPSSTVRLLRRIGHRAAADDPEAATWSAEETDLARDLLRLHRRAETYDVDDPVVLAEVRSPYEEGLSHVLAAERWFLSPAPDPVRFRRTDEALRAAEAIFGSAGSQDWESGRLAERERRLRSVLEAWTRGVTELPAYAASEARRMEFCEDREFPADVVRSWVAAGCPEDLGPGSRSIERLLQRTRAANEYLVDLASGSADETPADPPNLTADWDALDRAFSQRLRALQASSATSARDWFSAEALTFAPVADAAEREVAWRIVSNEGIRDATEIRRGNGLWQAYWAIRVLESLAGESRSGGRTADVAELWSAWERLVGASEDSAEAVAERGRLGSRLRAAFAEQLAERRSSGGSPRVSGGGHSLADVRRRVLVDEAIRSENRDGSLLGAETLVRSGDEVALNLGDVEFEELLVLSDARDLQVGAAANPERIDGVQAVSRPKSDAGPLTFAIAETTSPRADVTIALLDARGVPCAFQRLAVNPPLDLNAWRIVVSTTRDDAPHDVSAELQPGRARFVVPPRSEFADPKPEDERELRFALEGPALPNDPGVMVRAFRRNGDRWEPLTDPTTVDWSAAAPAANERRRASVYPPPAPASDPEGGETKPAETGTTIDVTEGLLFEIGIGGEPPIPYLVQPRFEPAADLVEFGATLVDDELRVTMRYPRPAAGDPLAKLAPATIFVVPRVVSPSGERQLAPRPLVLGAEPTEIRERLSPAEMTSCEFQLDVAGQPHVFAVSIEDGRRVEPQKPFGPTLEAKIAGANVFFKPRDPGLKRDETVVVAFDVHWPQLEREADEWTRTGDERWEPVVSSERFRIGWTRIAPSGSTFPGESLRLRAPLDRSVSLRVGGGRAVLDTLLRRHQVVIPVKPEGLGGLELGRHRIESRLEGAADVPAEPVFFAVDDESPPELALKSGTPREVPTGQPLNFEIAASDAESGISRVELFVTDGKPPAANAEPLNVYSDESVPISLDFAEIAKLLGPMPENGDVGIWVRAYNGVAATRPVDPAEKSLAFTYVKPKPRTTVPKTGTLVVNVSFKGRATKWTVSIEGPTSAPPQEGSRDRFAFDKLDPGAYEVTVSGGRRKTTTKVEVKAGRRATADVTPSI